MRVVGQHLVDQSLALGKDSPDFDAFARSAFNRYYYSMFLEARSVASHFISGKIDHSSLPSVLRGKILKELKEAIKAAYQVGQIPNKNEAESKKRMVMTALSDMANVLGESYEIRKIADYVPGIKVELSPKGELILHDVNCSDLIKRNRSCQQHAHVILGVMKELGFG